MRGLLAAMLSVLGAAAPLHAVSADSLRREVSRLASQGRMDEALELVEANDASLPAAWNAMFRGKLELDGDKALKGYKNAAGDSAPPQMRGEAVYRQGQYQYAAGRYHLAIPQFREYLAKYPAGPWSEASAYWMAYACIQLAGQRAGKEAYLDSAQAYLRKLEFRGRSGYYWPLARAAQARIHLLKGDTVAAMQALRDARAKAPEEERPGVLLLSLQAENPNEARRAAASEWEDSLRWNYPLSPETRLLGAPRARAVATSPAPTVVKDAKETKPADAKGGYSLQLGVFSLRENAEKLRRELAAKKITARIEPMRGRDRELYRVLYGSFAGSEAALAEGKRLLKPKGYEYRATKL